jgi:hypothetical protein
VDGSTSVVPTIALKRINYGIIKYIEIIMKVLFLDTTFINTLEHSFQISTKGTGTILRQIETAHPTI